MRTISFDSTEFHPERALSERRLAELVGAAEAALPADPGVGAQFMSDIHGEAAAFDHLVRTASGELGGFLGRALGGLADPGELAALHMLLAYPDHPASRGLADAADVDLEGAAGRLRAHCTGTFHLVGDLWDRGANGDDVVDVLMGVPGADVQWGNHDICWMGAAAGDEVCIATCLRNNIKYGNVAQFEEGYGIDLGPLFAFAERAYGAGDALSPVMKAISAILFKCEGQAIARHPEWRMGERLLWGAMDPAARTVPVYGVSCRLSTGDFPTWRPDDPYGLSGEERRLMDGFVGAFTSSARLQRQVQWLYDNGGVYRVVEGDALLFHGCVPLAPDGSFAQVDCGDRRRSGRELLDWVDGVCRRAWDERDPWALDWMGQLWCGWQSTFAGRVVKTFERTYIEDKETWKEPEDPYYALTREDAAPCAAVLGEFGVDPERGVIVNGHTPVKLPKGERPVRGGGRRLVIDGGLCAAYRKTTGIAGYTLVREGSGALRLVTHGEFPGLNAVLGGTADVGHSGERVDAGR